MKTTALDSIFTEARYYSPVLQRFVGEDPIAFAGGDVNLHAYGGTDPINAVDPTGLSFWSNWDFFWDWALGRDPSQRTYGQNDFQTHEMWNSIGVHKIREQFRNGTCQSTSGLEYGTYEAYWDTIANPYTSDIFSTSAQVGGFAGASAKNNGNGTVTFTIVNTAGTKSFFFHAVPNRTSGMGRSITQRFEWTESVPVAMTYGRKGTGCQ